MRRLFETCIMVSFLILCASISQVFSIANNGSEKITVEAEGSGETKIAAMKEAWTDAVRKAVGMYMASKSEVRGDSLSDEYTDEIAAYSRGQVNSFEPLSETHENGIWHVVIRANVDRDIMQETIAAASSQTVKVDGANLAAQIQTADNKKKDAVEVIRTSGLTDFTKCLDYNARIQVVEADGKKLVFMCHILKFDLKKFKARSDQLEKVIAQMATSKRDEALNTAYAKDALKLLSMKDYSVKLTPTLFDDDMVKSRAVTQFLIGPESCILLNNNNQSEFRARRWFKNIKGGSPWDGLPEAGGYGDWEKGFDFRFNNRLAPEAENEICFMQNSANATCYTLPVPASSLLKNYGLARLRFYTESGSGYDNVLESTPVLGWSFPLSVKDRVGIGPLLYAPNMSVFYVYSVNIGNEVPAKLYNSQTFQYPVILLYQKLDIPVDKLVDMKAITGRYTLEPF